MHPVYLTSRVVSKVSGESNETYQQLSEVGALDFIVNQLLVNVTRFIFCDRSIYVRLTTHEGDTRMVLLKQGDTYTSDMLLPTRVCRMYLFIRELGGDSMAAEALGVFRDGKDGSTLMPLGLNFELEWTEYFPAHTQQLAVILGLMPDVQLD